MEGLNNELRKKNNEAENVLRVRYEGKRKAESILNTWMHHSALLCKNEIAECYLHEKRKMAQLSLRNYGKH